MKHESRLYTHMLLEMFSSSSHVRGAALCMDDAAGIVFETTFSTIPVDGFVLERVHDDEFHAWNPMFTPGNIARHGIEDAIDRLRVRVGTPTLIRLGTCSCVPELMNRETRLHVSRILERMDSIAANVNRLVEIAMDYDA